MLLAAGPSFELLKFIQILTWIIVPVLLSAIGVAILLHYRKKKKDDKLMTAADAENNFILASPEKFTHSINDGEYVHFDHSNLIREYKHRMFYNHARFAALQKDYVVMQAKYNALTHNKNIYMKNHNEELLVDARDHAEDRKELSGKLEQLGRSYQRLEEENRFLQEQISLQTAGDEEREKITGRWKEEYAAMKDQVAERDYLGELLEEKKAQIAFLQNQLEQRIRNQHQTEQQRLQAITEMEKQQQVQQDKEEDLAQKQQALLSKLDQITYLENVLRETKEQNELLNASAADSRDQVVALEQQLADERTTSEQMQQKLSANKQLLRRLYKEFSNHIDEEEEKAPVIELRQVDENEWERSVIYPV